MDWKKIGKQPCVFGIQGNQPCGSSCVDTDTGIYDDDYIQRRHDVACRPQNFTWYKRWRYLCLYHWNGSLHDRAKQ